MRSSTKDFNLRLYQPTHGHLTEDRVEPFRSFYRSLYCLVLGVMIAACPFEFSFDFESGLHAKAMIALAKSGSGKDGDGGDDDSGDNSGSGSGNSGSDNSGSGSGNSGSGSSGSGNSDSGSGSGNSGSGSSNSGSGSQGNGKSSAGPRLQEVGLNLHLTYSNGWEEEILNGRYELKDPQGRTVSRRSATKVDYGRMREAARQ